MRPTLRRLLWTLVSLAVLAAAGYGALFTELGVLGIGHHFWMYRAAHSKDEASLRENLVRVLEGTQYGVNVAENWVLEVEDRETRIRLWGKLIELAPNESWRGYYQDRLEAEALVVEGGVARPEAE